MSAVPEGATGGAAVSASEPSSVFSSCWSCRVICGSGLVMCGAYVFFTARQMMNRSKPPSMFTVAQFTFAAGLAAMGAVVLIDPARKQKKT